MRFNRRARLDTSEIRDRRGSGGRAVATGAGGLGIVGVIIAVLVSALGGSGGGLADVLSGQVIGAGTQAGGVEADNTAVEGTCQTGADANERDDCQIVGVVNSVQDFWLGALDGYEPTFTNFFEGGVSTGCGQASSAVGPFYCPADRQVYIDLGFFEQLANQLGASGDFARAYVIAHEYGHHVQNLTGYSQRVQQSGDREGPESDGVRLELQADCLAGMWARAATTVPDPSTGVTLIDELTDQDIRDALGAAAAVGDDRIQEATTGQVNPEGWTHGSSEQREDWFRIGFDVGSFEACDTFEADDL